MGWGWGWRRLLQGAVEGEVEGQLSQARGRRVLSVLHPLLFLFFFPLKPCQLPVPHRTCEATSSPLHLGGDQDLPPTIFQAHSTPPASPHGRELRGASPVLGGPPFAIREYTARSIIPLTTPPFSYPLFSVPSRSGGGHVFGVGGFSCMSGTLSLAAERGTEMCLLTPGCQRTLRLPRGRQRLCPPPK